MGGLTGLSGLSGESGIFGGDFDWYVDSVGGNDANTGKSPDQAFATIAALAAAGIAAGDRIGLARGSNWREQLTISVNNVAVQAYSSGNAPILDASDVAANASFSATAGTANVYEASVTIAGVAALTWVSAWEDDTRLVRASSIANCDATAGSYYPSSDATAGAITLYIHASDSSDVSANGKVYEFSARRYGLVMSGNNCMARGITTKRNLDTSGSLVISGVNDSLYDCRAEEGNKHNVYVGAGGYLEGVVASAAYYGATAATMFIYNSNSPAGDNITYVNCTAELSTLGATITGYYGHPNLGGNYGTATYRNCTATNLGSGIDIGQSTNQTSITGGTMTGCNVAVICLAIVLPPDCP